MMCSFPLILTYTEATHGRRIGYSDDLSSSLHEQVLILWTINCVAICVCYCVCSFIWAENKDLLCNVPFVTEM